MRCASGTQPRAPGIAGGDGLAGARAGLPTGVAATCCAVGGPLGTAGAAAVSGGVALVNFFTKSGGQSSSSSPAAAVVSMLRVAAAAAALGVLLRSLRPRCRVRGLRACKHPGTGRRSALTQVAAHPTSSGLWLVIKSRTATSSSSNDMDTPGGMSGGAPASPYAYAELQSSRTISPTRMRGRARSQEGN
eukprot:scaffold2908_cov105-Isochrysis_galbana.AAC.16